MASVSIRRRESKSGARFQVRYRLGGRSYPVVHGGSFATLKEARLRRDLIGGELAAGRNPADLLRAMVAPRPVRTFADLYDEFTASRVDVAEATRSTTERTESGSSTCSVRATRRRSAGRTSRAPSVPSLTTSPLSRCGTTSAPYAWCSTSPTSIRIRPATGG
jgi:hypothetical protein